MLASGRPSDLHDLLFLGLDDLVDVGAVLVGQLLDLVAVVAVLVLGDRRVLEFAA